jgi:tetratricopeptide (TPR) repeat protein
MFARLLRPWEGFSMMCRLVVSLALVAAAGGCRTAGPGRAAAVATTRDVAPSRAAPAQAAPDTGHLALAARAFESSRFEQALEEYAAAAAEAPSDPRPAIGVARVRLAQARLEPAIAAATEALTRGAGADARLLRARALAILQRFDEAARDVEAALERTPKDVTAWAMLAAIHQGRGDEAQERRAFAAATALAGEKEAVGAVWTQLLAMPPDPRQTQESQERCTRGHAAALEGKWNEAQHEYVNGLKRAQRFEWCMTGVAEATWRLGDPDRAEAILRKVIEGFDPAKPLLRADARGKLAALLLARGNPSDAAAEAQAALAARPGRVALLDTLAQACDATGDAAGARATYAQLLAAPHVAAAVRARAEARVAGLGLTVAPASATP